MNLAAGAASTPAACIPRSGKSWAVAVAKLTRSTTPLPQTGAQFTSVFELHAPPAGQHPSLVSEQVVMVPTSTHCLWQPVPCSARCVQAWFGQVEGQLPSQNLARFDDPVSAHG